MELIERQAAIDAFEDTTFTKNEIRRRLSEVPPAQPEIIYCNDCIHYSKHNDDYMCGVNVLAYVRETDYCSRAERKADADAKI